MRGQPDGESNRMCNLMRTRRAVAAIRCRFMHLREREFLAGRKKSEMGHTVGLTDETSKGYFRDEKGAVCSGDDESLQIVKSNRDATITIPALGFHLASLLPTVTAS